MHANGIIQCRQNRNYQNKKGPNYLTPRSVGYKLYDPEGYVISSGDFDTGVALKMGEKFKDKEESIGYCKVKTKGIYRLELMNEG